MRCSGLVELVRQLREEKFLPGDFKVLSQTAGAVSQQADHGIRQGKLIRQQLLVLACSIGIFRKGCSGPLQDPGIPVSNALQAALYDAFDIGCQIAGCILRVGRFSAGPDFAAVQGLRQHSLHFSGYDFFVDAIRQLHGNLLSRTSGRVYCFQYSSFPGPDQRSPGMVCVNVFSGYPYKIVS